MREAEFGCLGLPPPSTVVTHCAGGNASLVEMVKVCQRLNQGEPVFPTTNLALEQRHKTVATGAWFLEVFDQSIQSPVMVFYHLLEAQRQTGDCLLYTSPSPRDRQKSRMPSSA